MKRARLLHNPTAGDNEFSKKELLKLIREEGFECEYASVKEDGWDDIDDDTDFLIIAGGDGTVRRVAKSLMKRTRLQKLFPLALLPHGTANNVACSMHIDGEVKDIVSQWHHADRKPFDIGKVSALGENKFFLEALGFGIFPKLMKTMEKMEDELEGSAEEMLDAARKTLVDIVNKYEARHCKIVADGHEYEGDYLMVEVMNIRSIGPNLILSPDADPGDGLLDVVLVSDSHRHKFESFLKNQIDGREQEFTFTTIRAKRVEIKFDFKDLHLDDERIKTEDLNKIVIEVKPAMLEFLQSTEQQEAL